jgi:hypothetical protein
MLIFFQIKSVYKENIEFSKNILFVEMKKWINYLIDMCQSCQGTMTHMIWSNMTLIFGGKKMLETKFIIYYFINSHNRIMSSNCWAWTTHSPIMETLKDKKGIKWVLPISSLSHYNLIYKGLGTTLNWSLPSLFMFTHCLVYKINPKIFGSMVITITWKNRSNLYGLISQLNK